MRDQLSWSGRWCRGKGWSLPDGGGWLSPGGSPDPPAHHSSSRSRTLFCWHWLCSAVSQRAGSPSARDSRIKNSMKGQTRAGGEGTCQNHMCWPFQRWRKAWVTLSCPTLCDPMDCRPRGSSVHGILQARTLEWVAMPFSRGSSPPRDWTCLSCIGRQIPYHWATWEARLQDVKHRLAVFEEGAVNPVALLR